jgi:hypothetical protein
MMMIYCEFLRKDGIKRLDSNNNDDHGRDGQSYSFEKRKTFEPA